MTVYVKVLQKNEEKQEIKTGSGIIMHMGKILLWRKKEKKKTTQRTEEYKQVAISDCVSSLSCCSAWPWLKLMYKQVAIGKVMSAVPYMSGFIFRIAVFCLISLKF